MKYCSIATRRTDLDGGVVAICDQLGFNLGVTRMTDGTAILKKRTESYVKAKESQHQA